LILQRNGEGNAIHMGDKASINFCTDHSKGSLARVLNLVASCDINLSKLQSMPIPGSAFQYSFYADLEFDTIRQLEEVISLLKKNTENMILFGVYKNGKLNNSQH
jgi:prephenate dehydratase